MLQLDLNRVDQIRVFGSIVEDFDGRIQLDIPETSWEAAPGISWDPGMSLGQPRRGHRRKVLAVVPRVASVL